MRDLLSVMLKKHKYQVISASDGVRGLALAKKRQPNLIITDWMMPNMSGFEAMREIRRRDEMKNIPVIALTAKAMPGDREKCLDVGMNDYLTKPIKRDIVFATLGKWVFQPEIRQTDQ